MKLKNTWNRSYNVDGQWVSPGETVVVSEGCDWKKWVNLNRAEVQGLKVHSVPINKIEERRKNLMEKPMDELRKIGNPLGAKDTKKSELVDEILKAEER